MLMIDARVSDVRAFRSPPHLDPIQFVRGLEIHAAPRTCTRLAGEVSSLLLRVTLVRMFFHGTGERSVGEHRWLLRLGVHRGVIVLLSVCFFSLSVRSSFRRQGALRLHHLGDCFLEFTFGIEHELTAGHDDLALVKAVQDFDHAVLSLHAHLDLTWFEFAFASIDENELTRSRVNVCLSGNQECISPQVSRQCHIREHAGLEIQRRIVKLQPHLDDARLFLEVGIDVHDRAYKLLAPNVG